jgi:hypothetical protein
MKKSALTIAFEEIDQGVEAPELDLELQVQMPAGPLSEDLLGPISSYKEVEQAVEHLNLCVEQYNIALEASRMLAVESISDCDKKALGAVINVTSKNHTATEGFIDKVGDVAKRVYNAIAAMIKRFIEFIRNFFTSLDSIAKKIKNFEARIGKLETDKYLGDEKILASKAPIGYFSGAGAPRSMKDYLKELNYTQEILKGFYGAIGALVDMFSRVSLQIQSNKGRSAAAINEAGYGNLVKEITRVLQSSVNGRLGINTEIVNDDTQEKFNSHTFLGCDYLTSTIPKVSEEDKISFKKFSEFIYHIRIDKTRDDSDVKNHSNVEAAIPTVKEMEDICDLLTDIVTSGKELEKQSKSDVLSKVKLFSKLAYIGSTSKSIEPNSYIDMATPRNIEAISLHVMLGLSRTAIQISSIPMSIIFNVCRGGNFVMNTSLHAYETSNKDEHNPNAQRLAYSK